MLQAIMITWLLNGGVYALLAVGFSLIFGVARMLNFSHTAYYMLGAFFAYSFWHQAGLNIYVASVLSVVAAVVLGTIIYKVFIERVREHETTVMIVTIALAYVIQEVVHLVYGGEPRGVIPWVAGYVELWGIHVSLQQLTVLGVVAIVLVALLLVLRKAKIGVAIRAVAQDRELGNLVGIDVGRICLLVMGMSVGLGAICGVTVASLVNVEPNLWMSPLLMILGIVVVGGMGSIKGSVMVAFIIALAETLIKFFVPSGAYLSTVVAMVAIIIMLIVRPEGLYGVVFEEERL